MTISSINTGPSSSDAAFPRLCSSPSQSSPDVLPAQLPLFLLAASRCSVSARETLSGGSLLVRSPRLADRRFPIARISRIVTAVHHDWSGSALVLCLRAAVPVVFLGRAQRPAGWLMPATHSPSRLNNLLEEFLCLPDWHVSYSNWLRAERNHALNSWQHLLSQTGKPVTGSAMNELRRRYVYQPEGSGQTDVPDIWHSASLALVVRVLTSAGLDAAYTACDARTLSLAEDCAGILGLYMYPGSMGVLRGRSPDSKLMLEGFECKSAGLQLQLLSALRRLQRSIFQELNRCR